MKGAFHPGFQSLLFGLAGSDSVLPSFRALRKRNLGSPLSPAGERKADTMV